MTPEQREKKRARNRKMMAKAYAANPEKFRARTKASNKADPERKAAWDKRYRENNREACAARDKMWREANTEQKKATAIAWELANPDKVKAGRKRYKAKARQARRDNPSERMRVMLMTPEEHLEHTREKSREHMRGSGKIWREANPDKVKQYHKTNRKREWQERRDNPSPRMKKLLHTDEERLENRRKTRRVYRVKCVEELRPVYLKKLAGTNHPLILDIYKIQLEIKRYMKENRL
jgi:hypothetical protein